MVFPPCKESQSHSNVRAMIWGLMYFLDAWRNSMPESCSWSGRWKLWSWSWRMEKLQLMRWACDHGQRFPYYRGPGALQSRTLDDLDAPLRFVLGCHLMAVMEKVMYWISWLVYSANDWHGTQPFWCRCICMKHWTCVPNGCWIPLIFGRKAPNILLSSRQKLGHWLLIKIHQDVDPFIWPRGTPWCLRSQECHPGVNSWSIACSRWEQTSGIHDYLSIIEFAPQCGRQSFGNRPEEAHWEAIAQFRSEHASSLELTLFQRWDLGLLEESKYKLPWFISQCSLDRRRF